MYKLPRTWDGFQLRLLLQKQHLVLSTYGISWTIWSIKSGSHSVSWLILILLKNAYSERSNTHSQFLTCVCMCGKGGGLLVNTFVRWWLKNWGKVEAYCSGFFLNCPRRYNCKCSFEYEIFKWNEMLKWDEMKCLSEFIEKSILWQKWHKFVWYTVSQFFFVAIYSCTLLFSN